MFVPSMRRRIECEIVMRSVLPCNIHPQIKLSITHLIMDISIYRILQTLNVIKNIDSFLV